MRTRTFGVLRAALASGLLRAADNAWDDGCESVGLSAGGSIFQGSCSPHDPNLLTVATDMGGAFITYDAGARWHTIHYSQLEGAHYASAAFHPTDPNVIYWVGGSGRDLKVSRDKGRTWTHVGKAQPWKGRLIRVWLDPDRPERIFGGTDSATYLSRDEGQTWSECAGATGALLRVVVERTSPAERRVYMLGTSAGVYRSDDDARTFARKTQGLPGATLAGFAGGSNEKGTTLYASVPCTLQDGRLAGGVFRSRDRGENWERCMTAGINVRTNRADEYAQGDLPQYKWIACADRRPGRAYVFCDGTSYWPPNHATLYRTDNGGDSWQAVLYTDPRFRAGDSRLRDPREACNVETDWQAECWGQREQGSLRGLEISAADPDRVVIVQEREIHTTADAGKTWQSPYAGTCRVDADGRRHWATSGEVVTSSWNYYLDPFDRQRHFICYTDICLARSLDGGRTWLPEGFRLAKILPEGWNNTCYALAFDPDVPGRVWGAFSAMHDIPNANAVYYGYNLKRRGGGVAVSDDHGATWKKLDLPLEGPCVSVVVDPASPRQRRTLYASLFGRGVFRSADGGATWQAKTNGFDPSGLNRCLNLVLHRDGTLFVATTGRRKLSAEGVGLWRSADKGESWTNLAAGQPWAWIRDFTVKPDDSRTVLVPTSHVDAGLHRTTDGGRTWETISQSHRQMYFFGATYHPTRSGWIYLTRGESEDGDGYGMYLSKDDGRTWTPFPKIPFRNLERIAFDPHDSAHIYVTTFGSSVVKAPTEP